MKTSDQVKLAGFKSLKELAEKRGVTTETLRNWEKHKPDLFRAALSSQVKATKQDN